MMDRRSIASVALGHREVVVPTEDEEFAYLQSNWRGAYVIVRPGKTENVWRALACFGDGDVLEAGSAEELLEMVRRHYPGLIDRPVTRSQRK